MTVPKLMILSQLVTTITCTGPGMLVCIQLSLHVHVSECACGVSVYSLYCEII